MKEFTAKRLDKAERSIEAARRDLGDGHIDFATNHAYYAMFYVAEALLAERNLGFSKHGQVHGAYGKEFAKTGELEPRFHAWMLHAFEKRLEADYGEEEFEAPEKDIEKMIEQAEEFLAAAREHLEESA